MLLVVISILLLLPYVALITYYRNGWMQQKSYTLPVTDTTHYKTFISVIIPARNEEKNIKNCLNSIMQQSYSSDLFEAIVVNDHSTDATKEIVQSLEKNNVRLINLSEFEETNDINSYKKKAIEIAIGFAKGPLIVTTDADCIVPTEWLQTIASYYENAGAAFIAAPVAYADDIAQKRYGNKIFYIFQALDFMMLQAITGAAVYKKMHNMCNGANLSYEKKVFYEVGGFKNIDTIASGDDMLLMHKIQQQYPEKIVYLKSENCIVYTRPAASLSEFLNQRIRWASKANQYPDKKITAVLFLVYFFNAWLLFLVVDSFFYIQALWLFVISFFVKNFIELFFLLPVSKFFNRQKLLWWLLPLQPLHIIYTIVAGWLGRFGSYTWKERKVK